MRTHIHARWHGILLAAGLWHAAGMGTMACPICLGLIPQQPTMGDEIREAQALVVGRADSASGAFTIIDVIKGDKGLEGTQVSLADGPGAVTLLLARPDAKSPWKSLGPSGIQLAKFLPAFIGLAAEAPKDDAAWAARLALVQPFLGHLDPRVARSAWAEWARAPYAVVRSQRIEAAKLRTWLADPAQGYAHPLWITLLAVSGDTDDARRMDEWLVEAWTKNDATQVAALLTARIGREGDAGVAWLEDHYIRNRERTLDEIQAALTALSVQGAADAKLRPRILSAYRTLLAERRPLSGLVVRDLAAWEDWSAATHFEGLLASREAVLPQTVPAISAYLDTCRKQQASAKPATISKP